VARLGRIGRMKKIGITFSLLIFFFATGLIHAASVTLSTDSQLVASGEVFRFTLSAQGDFDSITEPDFKALAVENRSQSQSNSVSIMNGKMTSSKTISYTYLLRAEKSGVFKIGPAYVVKGKKKTASNTVTVTVTGSAGKSGSQNNSVAEEAGNESPTPSSLFAPLSSWEKRTPDSFLRAVVTPSEDIYQGEPLTVKYYLFVKPNSISDLNYYKQPSFENCWKEDLPQNRVNFERVAIDGTTYDYALLNTYTLIPEKGQETLIGTQMIVDVVRGGFFNTRKKSVSTPALRIPLKPLPETNQHPDGFYGDLSLKVDKNSLDLDKDNLLTTVNFKIEGCGNFQAAQIKLKDNPRVKIFPPEIETTAGPTANGYCGRKTFKFMIKGLGKGQTSIVPEKLDVFSREKGWYELRTENIPVNIKAISAGVDEKKSAANQSFELLKELPAGLSIYSLKPVTERLWFVILLSIPIVMTLFSLVFLFIRSSRGKRSRSFRSRMGEWLEKIENAESSNELLNTFYDAIRDLYSIELKGERGVNLEKKYGKSVDEVVSLIREIEYSSYSGDSNETLSPFKKKAMELIKFRGKK
jgi:hypothetical protein